VRIVAASIMDLELETQMPGRPIDEGHAEQLAAGGKM
jgi:hypothetical protein